MTVRNRLRERIARGAPSLGVWLGIPAPSVAEIVGHAGFDVAIVDGEHGQHDYASIMAALRALAPTGCTAMVRVPSHDAGLLKRVLDGGAEAVMVPMVETADEARAIVSACRYPPSGARGFAPGAARASRYGFDEAYVAESDDRLVLCLQIESTRAVANTAEIARVPGVDMLFLGAGDLSGSVGRLGDTGHPDVARQIADFEAACRAAGMAMGTIPRPGHDVATLARQGYALVAGAVDVFFVRDAATAHVAAFRAALG